MREVFRVLSIESDIHVARKVEKSFSKEEFRMIEKVVQEDSYVFGRATNGARYGTELIVYTFTCEPGALHENNLISGEADSRNGTALRDVYLLAKAS
jgi:hypothetical protein